MLEELNREDANDYENYTFNLTRVLCQADPALLVHRDTQIIEARHFLAGSFLVQEKERFIQRRLADAALSHFAYGAIEPVRQIVRTQRLDGELCTLRDYLVETCKTMGERFPEYDEWKATGERERAEHFRQLAEVSGDPQRMLLFAMQKLRDYHSQDEDEKEPPPKVACEALGHGNGGRNWPWPCRGFWPRQGNSARRKK